LENKNSDDGIGLKQKDRKLRRICLVLCVAILVSWAIFAFTPEIGGESSGIIPDIILNFYYRRFFYFDMSVLVVYIATLLPPLSAISMLIFDCRKVKHHKVVFAIEAALMSLNALVLISTIIIIYPSFLDQINTLRGPYSHHFRPYFLIQMITLVIQTALFILLLVFNARFYIKTIKLKKLGKPQ